MRRPEAVRLIVAHPRLLAFGFLLPFASAFGQTFFIGLFGGPLRETFALSDGQFGLLYSLATVTSAALLMWLGRLIDRVDLRLYTAATGLAYAGACLYMSQAPAWPPALFLAFLLLRLTGQGLMSHIGITTMGRSFEHGRGAAVSLASLGFPAAEAVIPPVAVAVIAALGWRQAWLVAAIALALAVVPAALILLRGHAARERARRADRARRVAAGDDEGRGDWRVREVVRDPRFYLMLPASLLAPFAVTGVFFHQAALVAAKGWTMGWFATAFAGFALCGILSTVASGMLVDRLGARRLLPLIVLPIAAGLLLLAAADAPWVAIGFMVGAGLTGGASQTLQGALWAEVYGITHLGAVRSLVYGLMVTSTAASPVLFGAMMDAGLAMERLALGCVGLALAAGALALPIAGEARGLAPRRAS
jgi:MFS family permease